MLIPRLDQSWRLKAACRNTDPSEWDTPPARKCPPVPSQESTCRACPVIRECAADAIVANDRGVIRAAVPIPANGPGRALAHRALTSIALGDLDAALAWLRSRYE